MVKNYQTAREGNEKKGPNSLKEINWISELLIQDLYYWLQMLSQISQIKKVVQPQLAQTLCEFVGLWIFKRMYENEQNTS